MDDIALMLGAIALFVAAYGYFYHKYVLTQIAKAEHNSRHVGAWRV